MKPPAVIDRRPSLWYVSSSQADETLVNLYRIDVRSGERKEMASWHRATRVDQAWIAYAPGRVCVTTASPDMDTECFDAGSGARVSGKVNAFAAQKADPAPPRAALWPPSSFLLQSGRLYAYTADGHAYAMTVK